MLLNTPSLYLFIWDPFFVSFPLIAKLWLIGCLRRQQTLHYTEFNQNSTDQSPFAMDLINARQHCKKHSNGFTLKKSWGNQWTKVRFLFCIIKKKISSFKQTSINILELAKWLILHIALVFSSLYVLGQWIFRYV